MRKERFSTHKRSKLNPRGDGPFQILEKINDNTYKVDLPGDFNVSTTFNVADLSPFDVSNDSRSNPFEKRGYDESYAKPIGKDPLVALDGLLTRSRAKMIKEAMAGLVQSTWAKLAYSPSKTSTFKIGFKKEEPALIHVI